MRTLIVCMALGSMAHAQSLTQQMRRTQVSVELTEAPLDALADVAAGALGRTVRVSSAVDAEDLRFSLTLKDVSVKTLLRVTLLPRGLTLTERDGVLTIVPVKSVDEALTTRIYDVGDLVTPLMNHPPPQLMIGTMMTLPQNVLFKDEGRFGGIFAAMDAADEQVAESDVAADALQALIEAEAWQENPKAGLSFANHRMIVRHSEKVHRQVQDLLDRLRKFR